MSNLPEVKRLLLEDFRDVEGKWMARLISPINTFNEQVYNLLNKGVTLNDNIQCSTQQITFTTASDYEANGTFTPLKLSWTNRIRPTLLFLGRVNDVTGTIIKEPVVVTDWVLSGPNQILVRFMTGLKNSTKYIVTFLIY